MRKLVTKIKSSAEAMKGIMTKKASGDSQLVVALVLVAVAIGLCIIFKDQISTVMTNLFTTLGTTITNLGNGTATK